MEKAIEKQQKFFSGDKKELLQLLYLFPGRVVCNDYSEISPYYPCIYLGETFKEQEEDIIYFIVSEIPINNKFVHVTEEKLKNILCDFFGCTPPMKSNEPFLSLIYKYSIYKGDARCIIPQKRQECMTGIYEHIYKTQRDYTLSRQKKTFWIYFLQRTKYSFLKTGNQTLANYISLMRSFL